MKNKPLLFCFVAAVAAAALAACAPMPLEDSDMPIGVELPDSLTNPRPPPIVIE